MAEDDALESEIKELEDRLVALRARRDFKEWPKFVKNHAGEDVIAESPEHAEELATAPATPAVPEPLAPPDQQPNPDPGGLAGLGKN